MTYRFPGPDHVQHHHIQDQVARLAGGGGKKWLDHIHCAMVFKLPVQINALFCGDV